jgi:ATP-binding cassette subfamily B protein
MLIRLLRKFLGPYRTLFLVFATSSRCAPLLPTLNADIIDKVSSPAIPPTSAPWGQMLENTFVQVMFAIAAVFSRVAMAFGRDVRQALFHRHRLPARRRAPRCPVVDHGHQRRSRCRSSC